MAEAQAQLRQGELVTELHGLMQEAAGKAKEALTALEDAQKRNADVARLGGWQRTWSPLGGRGLVVQLAAWPGSMGLASEPYTNAETTAVTTKEATTRVSQLASAVITADEVLKSSAWHG